MASCSCARALAGSAFLTGGVSIDSSRKSQVKIANTVARRKTGRRKTTAPPTRAILVPQPPEPPRKPSWQEQLSNVTQNGPSGMGRKNRGPRRTIKPHIKQTSDKPPPPNSVDAQLRKWEAQSTPEPRQQQQQQQQRQRLGGEGGGGGSGGDDASAASSSSPSSLSSGCDRRYYYGFSGGPQQLQETMSYSFLGQSTVRYPFSTADPSDPASRGIYHDSKADELAIELAVDKLAEAAKVKPETLGDARSYQALGAVALTLWKTHQPTELRQIMAGVMRRQLAVSMPPLTPLAMRSLLPSTTVSEVNAAVVSEATEWLFGPTTRETLAGPNGSEVTVVNVKKCRFLESTGCAGACASMCKLPVQDVIPTEFGVPVYMQPNYRDCSCRMFFGMEPLPENIDPALRYAAAERTELYGGGGGGDGVVNNQK